MVSTQSEPGLFSRGPFPIPAKRRIANQLHRIFSIKAGMRVVCVESPLEADAVYWGESIPDIIELCEQPLRIHQAIGNKPYFTFDISFRWTSGNECFYEIKPESVMTLSSSNRLVPKNWEIIENICSANAYTCKILSDKILNEKSLELTNWRRLLPYARYAYESNDPWIEEMITDFLAQMDKATIHQLTAQIPHITAEKLLCFTAKLIHQGVISSNLNNARLSGMTILKLVRNDN